ncbi:MAG TPA: SIMPL domain-containing protein [Syntrophales bacterium]|nr:SIMPL domain-containing protein [Syntrophales bacterium]HPI56007.1 SIMPL domain-containing protein [Syntrophales bacterium]
MKKLCAFLVLIPILTASSIAMAQPPERPGVRPPSITVVGTGEAYGKPDLAHIQVGVVTEGATAAEALRKNNEAMNRLMAMLRKRGIEERDFQTVRFNVSPRYRYDKTQQEPPAIAGYQVTNEVHVKLRKVSTLGEFLDETVSLGANQICGISFDVADPAKLFDEARRKAMTDAHHRAGVYADAARLKLGGPITIEEQAGRTAPFPVARAESMAAQAVPVAPGEQTFTIHVTVSFAIVDSKK